MKPGTVALVCRRFVHLSSELEGLTSIPIGIDYEFTLNEPVFVLGVCQGMEWSTPVKVAQVITRCGKVGYVQARYLFLKTQP